MDKLCYIDLKKLSESDRWYSMAISPLTAGAVSGLSLFLLAGFGPMPAIAAGVVAIFVWLIHKVFGWSDFSSNWKYYYVVQLGNSKYHIVKDGARRVRVIKDDGSVLTDVKTNELYMNNDLKDWLGKDSPVLGKLDVDSSSISIKI